MKIIEVRIVAPDVPNAKEVAQVIASRFPGAKVDVPKPSNFGDFRLYMTFGLMEEG